MYPLVSKLYSIAVIQPLSTAEVERIFSQVALIKTSHRANIKSETLFIDLQILAAFLYICNNIYINNESCRCIEFDAKS